MSLKDPFKDKEWKIIEDDWEEELTPPKHTWVDRDEDNEDWEEVVEETVEDDDEDEDWSDLEDFDE